jgi:Ca-activated chloride channel family protein
LAVALSPLLMGFALPGTVERLCGRGNKLYAAEKYPEAAETYSRALKLRPDDPTLQHNRGAALYKAGQLQASEQAFSAAMADAPQQLQQDLHYNIGNARYRLANFKGAIEQYKQALRLKPDDGEAKYNLELAQRKLKEQEEQQQQRKDQQEQEQPQEEKPQDEPSREEEEEQAQQQEAEREQAEQAEADQAERQETDEEGQAMSREQAAALLRALAAEDAALQRIIRRAPPTEARPVEKDW